MAVGDLFMEVSAEHPRGEKAQRDVDEKDAAPDAQLREDAAQQRSDDRRDGPDTGEIALHSCSFGQCVDVADDGHRGGLDGARAEALNGPKTISAGMFHANAHRIEPARNRRDPRAAGWACGRRCRRASRRSAW